MVCFVCCVMSACDCLVWLCGVFVSDCVVLYVVCVGVCCLRCVCVFCGLLCGVVWCGCFVCF